MSWMFWMSQIGPLPENPVGLYKYGKEPNCSSKSTTKDGHSSLVNTWIYSLIKLLVMGFVALSFLVCVCVEVVSYTGPPSKWSLKICVHTVHFNNVLKCVHTYEHTCTRTHRNTIICSSKWLSHLSPATALKLSCLFKKSWTYPIYYGSLLGAAILHWNCWRDICLKTKQN